MFGLTDEQQEKLKQGGFLRKMGSTLATKQKAEMDAQLAENDAKIAALKHKHAQERSGGTTTKKVSNGQSKAPKASGTTKAPK